MADAWISFRHKFFCMAIPKNACTKTKLVLQQLDDLPLPLELDRKPPYFHPSNACFTAAQKASALAPSSTRWS